MRKIARPALLLTAAALLVTAGAAQAAEEMMLFISPAGQPFVAKKGQPYPIVDWFNGADKNKDGKLDKLEFRADAEAFFAILDRNKDGSIGSTEILIYERYIVPEILSVGAIETGLIRVNMQDEGGGGDDSSGLPKRQRLNTNQGAVQFSLFNEPEPVRAADRNLDYRVTLQEFRDQADRHFAALDLNGDGFLTLDELPQTPAEKAGRAKRVVR
jgi:hypothetical protein